MVEVHLHFVVSDGKHVSVEAVAVLVHEGHHGVHLDVVRVEVSVHAEDTLVEVYHVLRIVLSIGLCRFEREVEVVALVERFNGLFECVESEAEAAYKLERVAIGSFFHEFLVAVFSGVQLVSHGYVLVLFLVHS